MTAACVNRRPPSAMPFRIARVPYPTSGDRPDRSTDTPDPALEQGRGEREKRGNTAARGGWPIRGGHLHDPSGGPNWRGGGGWQLTADGASGGPRRGQLTTSATPPTTSHTTPHTTPHHLHLGHPTDTGEWPRPAPPRGTAVANATSVPPLGAPHPPQRDGGCGARPVPPAPGVVRGAQIVGRRPRAAVPRRGWPDPVATPAGVGSRGRQRWAGWDRCPCGGAPSKQRPTGATQTETLLPSRGQARTQQRAREKKIHPTADPQSLSPHPYRASA